MRTWIVAACLFLFAGVALGAFGAHVLRDSLTDYALGVYEKAVLYHLVHAVGMLAVAMSARQVTSGPRRLRIVLILLSLGIVLFSGSLYLLAITGIRGLGAITPLGGLSFLAAWATLAHSAWREGDR